MKGKIKEIADTLSNLQYSKTACQELRQQVEAVINIIGSAEEFSKTKKALIAAKNKRYSLPCSSWQDGARMMAFYEMKHIIITTLYNMLQEDEVTLK